MTVQTLTQTTVVKANFLRRVLQADAIVEAGLGAVLIAGANPLAAFFGLDAPFLVGGGIAALFYAAWLFYLTQQPSLNRWAVLIAADVNAIWAGISGIILFTEWLSLTSAAWWTLAISADVAIVFAALQFYSLQQMSKK